MDWQLPAVVAATGLAAAYLGRATWRTWFGAGEKAGCGSACGGCAKPPAATPEDRRRVALPQV